jgi:hypothetical protein
VSAFDEHTNRVCDAGFLGESFYLSVGDDAVQDVRGALLGNVEISVPHLEDSGGGVSQAFGDAEGDNGHHCKRHGGRCERCPHGSSRATVGDQSEKRHD